MTAIHTLPLSKFDATAAPTVNDDVQSHYSVGSRWVDVTNDQEYVLIDPTQGAAIWIQLTLFRLAASTYFTAQHAHSLINSAGWTTGGVVTDAGSGTPREVNISAGTGFLRASDSDVADLFFCDWPAVSAMVTVTDAVRHVVVEYNSGSPQAVLRATDTVDGNTEFLLATIVNESETLHFTNHSDLTANVARELQDRLAAALQG